MIKVEAQETSGVDSCGDLTINQQRGKGGTRGGNGTGILLISNVEVSEAVFGVVKSCASWLFSSATI